MNSQHNLSDDEVEFIKHYLRTGLDGAKAARYTYGLTQAGAYQKSKKLLSDRRITNAIAEIQAHAMNELKIDATWVLREAVDIYSRCSQVEKILDRHGNETGEYRFDAPNALKALKMIGDHVNVKAFNARDSRTTDDSELVKQLKSARLRAARLRAAQLKSIGTTDSSISFF